MILNRYDLVKQLNDDTPECVLKEMYQVAGITYQNDYTVIAKFPGFTITDKYKKNDLRSIARLLNPKHNWKKQALLEAFKFYRDYETVDYTSHDWNAYSIGQQTSDNPKTLNACMLYRICQELSLPVSKKTTTQEMFTMIELYQTGNWLPLQTRLLETLKYGRPEELISLAVAQKLSLTDFIIRKNQKSVPTFTYEELENAIPPRTPETHLDAVVLAAQNYQLDFTCCQSPLDEYLHLVDSEKSKDGWFPKDLQLRKRLGESLHRPYLLTNPRLKERFNGHFPPNMYRNEDLVELCRQEAISLGPEDNAYSELQLANLAETFYHGKQGNIANSETTFWEEVRDLDEHDVVIYGIGYDSDNFMQAFSYGELHDAFEHYNKFMNPSTKEIFSKLSINKLQRLCEHQQWPNESETSYQQRRSLADQIERIKIYNASKNRIIDNLVCTYQNLSEQDQQKVNQIFINLLHCGMYMRNWDGQGDYPLDSISTNFPTSEQIQVDHRVTQGLIALEKSCQEVPEMGDYILDLPLMEYNKGSGIFITVSNSSEGLTIRKRIEIVRRGEDENGVTSCIRLSSNKFCATAYYYMILLGFHLPFKMSEVSHIF